MKKIIAMALVLMLVLSLSISAFAANDGKITINGVAVQETTEGSGVYELVAEYGAYKMFDLVSYDTSSSEQKYSYKVTEEWEDFLTGEGAAYYKLNENDYVEWVDEDTAARSAAAAKAALAYAESKGLTPIAPTVPDLTNPANITTNAEGEKVTSISFEDLELGYYLVESSMGALCGLTTTNPVVNMSAKNEPPTLEKQVQEDSLIQTGSSSWKESNDADIGDTIHYDTTIDVHAGAQAYVLHDKMTEGLTFDGIVSITRYISGTAASETAAEGTDYTLVTPGTCGCSFEVVFSDAFCDKLGTGDQIVVLYDAILNDKAVVGTGENTNETWLEFGENHFTTHESTTTKTFAFDLAKVDSQRTLLPGAEFELYKEAEGGTPIPLVEIVEDGKVVKYRRATQAEIVAGTTTTTIKVETGLVRLEGFDSDKYYLKETKTPGDGYNLLKDRVELTISGKNLDANVNAQSGKPEIGSGVQVVNKTGNILPNTGSIGTTLFITFGLIVALGTGVLLVTKKRMSMIRE